MTVGVFMGPGATRSSAETASEIYPAPGNGVWTVAGRGWGHGRGLGQWSAQAAASQGGWSGERIVDWAYPGTTGGHVGNPLVRVRLTAFTAGSVTVRSPGSAALWVADKATGAAQSLPRGDYAIVAVGSTLRVRRGGQDVLVGGQAVMAGAVEVAAADGVQVRRGDGSWVWYRGMVRLAPDGAGGVTATNHLSMQEYLYGVVPKESPSWFHPQALRAQAFVARSYALATYHTGDYDLCDTTQCQVYGGRATVSAGGTVTPVENAATTSAVDSTNGWVPMWGGRPALTVFSSSTGGWTRGSDNPYLVAQPDPWSGRDPRDSVHSWRDVLSTAVVTRSCPGGGLLRRLVVLDRDGNGDLGGRITRARVDCTTGSREITDDAELRFGMRSSWWRPVTNSAPIGHLDSLSPYTAGLRATGWAADMDDPRHDGSLHVVLDGRLAAFPTTGGYRPDVASAFPGLGDDTGFTWQTDVSPGRHSVCVWAIDTTDPAGSSSLIGCGTVDVPGGSRPTGNIDSVSTSPGQITVQGWTADPDEPASPLTVYVDVDGALTPAVAGAARPDVAAAFPALGPDHGISTTLPAAAGDHTVCVYAVSGADWVQLRCSRVTVP